MATTSSYLLEPGSDTTETRRRRRLAEALLQQGMDTSPILSPWQGAARMGQALMGGWELGLEDKRDRDALASQKAQDAEFNATISKMYGGGGGVSSALGAGTPMGPIKLGGFEPSVGRVLQFEGGLNPADTNGTPSNMGINQAANPDVDVKGLTKDQAINIYRDRYWNPIEADKMDPRLAHVAFDTSVIAGPGKAKELLEKSGGDPEAFLKLREDFQNRLLQANPEKFGKYAKAWANRNATLRADIGVNPGGMFAVGGGGQATMAGGSDNLQPQPTQVASADMATAMQLLQRARTPQQMAIAKQMVEEAQKANDPLRALQIEQARRSLNKPLVEPTTAEREYELAKKQGFTGSFFDFKRTLAEAGSSKVINNMGDKADGKFEEKLAEGQAKLFTDMVTEGVNAKAETGQIRVLREQLARVPGGFGTGLVALASQYGIKLSPQADAIEAASAIINKLVPGQRLPGSGQMSDRDVELFKSSLPSLLNTPEGNRIILDTMESMAAYKEKQAEIATAVMDGEMTRKDAMKALRSLPDPLAGIRTVAKELPKASPPPPAPARSAPTQQDIEAEMRRRGLIK